MLPAQAPPFAHVGQPLTQPAPATLFAPGRFHAVVRVPKIADALYIVGGWSMESLRVRVVGGTAPVDLSGGPLPGARFGVPLPAGAASARAIVVDGTALNAFGGPVLRTASDLYAAAVTGWPALALFGMLAGLACIAAAISIATRSSVLAWYAGLLAAEAAASFNVLGALRPPATINQPLHAVMVGLVMVASLGFARAYFGPGIVRRRTMLVLAGLACSTWVYVAGGDVWQDLWLTLPEPFDSLVFFVPDLALLVVAVFALRRGRRDAIWFIASQLATLAGFYLQDVPFPVAPDVLANVVGVVAMSCGVALMLARREEERRHLQTAVHTDALTGLANRRAFDATLSVEWSRATRTQTPLALIMIDVDHFKRYNDRFGHPAGDSLLRCVAGTLSRTLQRSEDFVARYGGEEFAVILPGLTVEGACDVGERIRQAVQGLAPLEPRGEVTVSCGVAAVVAPTVTNSAQLLALADAALYAAKHGGRNRIAAYGASHPNSFERLQTAG